MDNLYGKLSKIGFRVNFDQKIDDFVDIEKTILNALYEVDSDSRLLGLIFSWMQVHGDHFIADKFFKLYFETKEHLGECPWVSALSAHLLHLKNHKFKKGIKKFKDEVWVGGRKSKTALKMDGGIYYLKELNIMIPKKHLRIRENDIFSVKELIKTNEQYKSRFIYGANWRSEIILTIKRGFKNPYQVAKELGIGYSRVWTVFNEYKLATV